MTPESSDREPWDWFTWICVILMFIASIGGSILIALQNSGVIK